MRFAVVLLCALVLVPAAEAGPRAAIVKVFGRHAKQALAVARCESRFDPRAVGDAGERGIFQIHPVHFGWVNERRLWQPLYNARVAYRLSKGGRDWHHWTCRP